MLKLKTHNKGTTTGYQSGLQERILRNICTKDGGDCESDNFRVMVTAVDRYITEVRYKRSIILWRGLKSWKQIIEKKLNYFGNNWRALTRNKDTKKGNRVIFLLVCFIW